MPVSTPPAPTDSSTRALVPVVVVIFLGFLCIGIPFATLPSYVGDHVGFGDFWIGSVLGAQSLMTLLTRHFAGTRADLEGPKKVVLQGLGLSIVSGLVSLLAISLSGAGALAVFFAARLLLGVGESFLITGALAWGIALLDPSRTGRVMAWSGVAMYASIAVSAPLSYWVGRHYGFAEVTIATVVAPLLAVLVSLPTPRTAPSGKERMPFYQVVNRVWRAGLGLSLSAVGFAALAGFAALYFKQKGWGNASLVMTTFGAAFVIARIAFSNAPDRYGGKRVAIISVVVEGVGLGLVWVAPSALIALIGAALTGFGYSLVFPSLGVEAVRRVEPQFKGAALGAYAAFFDLALGVTGPLAGLVAGQFGYSAVYLFGVISCAMAAWIAWKV